MAISVYYVSIELIPSICCLFPRGEDTGTKHCITTIGLRYAERNKQSTNLEGGHEISSLQKRQLADLVNNLIDLGVGRCSCLGGLPSPRPLGQVCRGREAQRTGGWADDLPAATSCDLRRNWHFGCKRIWPERETSEGEMDRGAVQLDRIKELSESLDEKESQVSVRKIQALVT
jgi:hypothetical protein